MSIEAVGWALSVPLGGNEKIMLMGLANHAHPDGTESYPALDTLASYGNCDRSTARRNVRKLVKKGWAIEDGLGPRGQTKYRLPLWRVGGEGGGDSPPVAPGTDGGGDSGPEGVASSPPKPSIEPSTNRPAGGGGRAGDDEVPPDFPDELRGHARHVMRVLLDLAERHGAKAVTARSLGNVMMARPRKPLVRGAHDFAAWADGKGRRQRDVVAGYRNWLDRCDDLAAVEPMPGEAMAAPPAGVTPLRQPRNQSERIMAAQERRLAAARGDGVPSAPYPIERGGA